MKTESKKYNVTENAKQEKVCTSTTQRRALEAVGIGGDSAGIYASGSYDGRSYIGAALAADRKKLQFGSTGTHILLAIGDRGIVVRQLGVRISACKKWVLSDSNALVALGKHGALEMRAVEKLALAKQLLSGEFNAESYKMAKIDGKEADIEREGIGFGGKEWKVKGYAGFMYAIGDKLVFTNMEARSFSLNKEQGVVRAAIGEASKEALTRIVALARGKVAAEKGAARTVKAKKTSEPKKD
jgi:hypothetical protein